MRWAQTTTERYPGVKVINLTSSWRDGLAFNSIIHRNRPDLIDYRACQHHTARDRLESAFHVAQHRLGITRLVEPEDVDSSHPDEKSMISYLGQLYQLFPEPPPSRSCYNLLLDDDDDNGKIKRIDEYNREHDGAASRLLTCIKKSTIKLDTTNRLIVTISKSLQPICMLLALLFITALTPCGVTAIDQINSTAPNSLDNNNNNRLSLEDAVSLPTIHTINNIPVDTTNTSSIEAIVNSAFDDVNSNNNSNDKNNTNNNKDVAAGMVPFGGLSPINTGINSDIPPPEDKQRTLEVVRQAHQNLLEPVIKTNKSNAFLSCETGEMIVKINFTEPFRGVAYADYDRSSPCKFFGDGGDYYELRLPLKGCGTKQEAPRLFLNNIIVRYHRLLELEEDEIKTIVCRYPPPQAPPPPPPPVGPPERM